MIWESQVEYSPGMKEAEQQQRRALTKYTTDILVILSGLGYVELSPRPTRCGPSFHLDNFPVTTKCVLVWTAGACCAAAACHKDYTYASKEALLEAISDAAHKHRCSQTTGGICSCLRALQGSGIHLYHPVLP